MPVRILESVPWYFGLLLAMRVLLYCLIQRHRSFVPAFGTFLFQLFIHRRGIHAADGFNRTDMLVLSQHVCHPTYFERQKQIQILLCDLAHHLVLRDSMFALRTRAAHLLLDCPLDTLRCALTASQSSVGGGRDSAVTLNQFE